MVNPWFKFYGGEYLSDPKMDALDGNERSCWITILSLANQSEDGVIKYATEKKILEKANINELYRDYYEGILNKLVNLGMIQLCNGDVTQGITVVNWEKRQYSEGYLRVKKHRQKISNENVTPKITIEERREEKKRKEKKRVEFATPEELEKDFFSNPLMAKIQEKYPDRDYKFYFYQMCEWYTKNKGRLPQSITAFTNWLDKTKPDEGMKAERLRKLANEEQQRKQKEIENIPRASMEKVEEMRRKISLIGRKI